MTFILITFKFYNNIDLRQSALEASDSFLPGSDIRKDQQGELKEEEAHKTPKSKNTLAIAQLEEFLMAQVSEYKKEEISS